MLALLTAFEREDLYRQTIESLCTKMYKDNIAITVTHDDSRKFYNGSTMLPYPNPGIIFWTYAKGQHASIEQFLKADYLSDDYKLDKSHVIFKTIANDKYYLHLEDDWLFENSYDWIAASIAIMEKDPMVIKVLARKDSPHPCDHTEILIDEIKYGYINPWTSNDGVEWCGFSWNPGVTRLDLLKKFIPLPTYEQELSKQIYDAGYKVVELSIPVYEHIGDGRSTHD